MKNAIVYVLPNPIPGKTSGEKSGKGNLFLFIKEKVPYFYGMKNMATSGLSEIPDRIDTHKTLKLIYSGKVSSRYLLIIKELTNEKDEEISDWFNISVKTFRAYKRSKNAKLKPQTKEQIVMILSLIKHGISVFGNMQAFRQWLETENVFFDKKSPISLINTISGLKFIDDRLTAMEYGDNV